MVSETEYHKVAATSRSISSVEEQCIVGYVYVNVPLIADLFNITVSHDF